MKKIKLLLVTICVVAGMQSAYSQAEVALGIKGGLNFATLNGTSSLSTAYDSRTGYHFGAYMLFKFTKIGIQPEVVFSRQGHSYTYSNTSFKDNYDYVNIPIMLKLYLAAGFNLQAGAQFGFLTSAQGSVINASTGGATTGQDLKNFVNSTDFSVPVGFGWDLPFGLSLAARYNIGMSDINKLTGSSGSTTVTSSMGTAQAKNQVIQISVGYRLFKLGK